MSKQTTPDGRYLIFLPKIESPSLDQLAAYGIADLVEGLSSYPIERGIGCDPGCCYVVQALGAKQPEEPPEVSAVETAWVHSDKLQANGEPAFWLGFDQKNRPGPQDLRRSKLADSTGVALCDGNVWQVPLVDRLAADRKDPTLAMLREEIAAALSLPGFESSLNGNRYIAGSRTLACAALRINYRIPAELVGAKALQLFDYETLAIATLAACGITRAIQRNDYQRNTFLGDN